jgi:hypothetical protein
MESELNKAEKSIDETRAELKISNQMIEKLLNDDEDGKVKPKKLIKCTKCKESGFETQDALRKHYKSDWHNFNVKLSSQGKEAFTAEEYEEYILMNPS